MKLSLPAASNLLLIFFFVMLPAVSYCLGVPELTGRVNDYADMLSKPTEEQLETALEALEQKSSTQIAILTVHSLAGENLEQYSLQVAESWKLGQEDLDNGVLLFIAKAERKIRIEVGYGLEGSLTDLLAGRVIRNIITPKFKNGNFDQGVIDGVTAMIKIVEGEYTEENLSNYEYGSSGDTGGAIVLGFFMFFTLGKISRGRKLLAGVAGAILTPLISLAFWGFTWQIVVLLIFVGFIAGVLASTVFARKGTRGRRSSGQ